MKSIEEFSAKMERLDFTVREFVEPGVSYTTDLDAIRGKPVLYIYGFSLDSVEAYKQRHPGRWEFVRTSAYACFELETAYGTDVEVML